MLDRSVVLNNAQFSDKFLKILVRELCPVVNDNGLRYAEAIKYVSFVETKYVLYLYFGQSLCFYPFCEVVHTYYQILILVRSYNKWSEDV